MNNTEWCIKLTQKSSFGIKIKKLCQNSELMTVDKLKTRKSLQKICQREHTMVYSQFHIFTAT